MVNLKQVEILGAGPTGLYTAILLKLNYPAARIRVTEQNACDATFGFGVVFSDRHSIFDAFQQKRQPVAKKIVDAANTSASWYDHFRSKIDMPVEEFAFSYLTRSGRIDMERLRHLSPGFMTQYQHFCESRQELPDVHS